MTSPDLRSIRRAIESAEALAEKKGIFKTLNRKRYFFFNLYEVQVEAIAVGKKARDYGYDYRVLKATGSIAPLGGPSKKLVMYLLYLRRGNLK